MSTTYYPPHHRALALDMATTTGWALVDRGQIRTGTFKTTRAKGRKTLPDEHEGIEFDRFEKWLWKMLKEFDPDVVFFEEAGGFRNVTTARKPYGYRGLMMACCARLNIPMQGVSPSTVKKFATGNGRAQKEEMIHAAKQKFPDVEVPDDNAADALHILAYGMSTKFQLEVL